MRIDRYVHDERLTWGAAGVLTIVTALHAAGIGRLFMTPPAPPDNVAQSPIFQVSLEKLPPPRLPRELVERPTEPSTSTDDVKQRPRMTRPVPILVDTPTTDPVPPDTQVKPYEIGDELLPGEPGPPSPEGVAGGEAEPGAPAAEETPVFWKMKYHETMDITMSRPNTNSPTASVMRRKFAKLIVGRASVGCMARPAFNRSA
jgi:hypothetical protein